MSWNLEVDAFAPACSDARAAAAEYVFAFACSREWPPDDAAGAGGDSTADTTGSDATASTTATTANNRTIRCIAEARDQSMVAVWSVWKESE